MFSGRRSRLQDGSRIRISPRWWPLAVLAVIGLGTGVFGLAIRSGNYAAVTSAWYLVSLATGLIIPQFGDMPVCWITRAAATIAKYSYGIYLSHLPIFWFAFVALREQPMLLRIATMAILSTAVPPALYLAVERPMIFLGKRLASAATSLSLPLQHGQTQKRMGAHV